MFRVKITSKARKELKTISKLHKETIALAIEELKENPNIGKTLKERLTGKFAIRVGVYRIIYKVSTKDKTVTIITAKHRAIAYQ